jgi:hypothetical protein
MSRGPQVLDMEYRESDLLPPYTHLGDVEENSIHSVCPWGQVRVKVLSPNPQLLRLGQLLAKPRGVVRVDRLFSTEVNSLS